MFKFLLHLVLMNWIFCVDPKFVINVHTVQVPTAVCKDNNYIFRYCDQGPSPNPLPIYAQVIGNNNNIVIGYTDTNLNVNIVTIKSDFQTIVSHHLVPGKDLRGLFAFVNGSTALLVRRGPCDPVKGCVYCGPPGPCPPADQMWFVLVDTNGNILANQEMDDRITDFNLGGGRLAYGFQKTYNMSYYEAYYKVHSISPMCEPIPSGHEGDSMKVFRFQPPSPYNPSAPISPPGFCWGCSHSMDVRLARHPLLQDFASVCVSDAYPVPGLVWNANKLIFGFPGYGNGATTGGLGSLIPDPLNWDGYIVLWSSPKSNAISYYTNTTELAILRVDRNGNARGNIVWLTNTPDQFEEAGHLVSFQNGAANSLSSSSLFLSWWTVPKANVTCSSCCSSPSITGSINAPRTRYFALLDAHDFSFLLDPQDVTNQVNFDERNDFFSLNQGAGFVAAWNSDPATCFPSQYYSKPTNNISLVTISLSSSSSSFSSFSSSSTSSSFPCAPSCIQLSKSTVPLPFPPTSANGQYNLLSSWQGTRPAYILNQRSRYIYFDSTGNGGQWLYDSDTNPNGYLGTTFTSSALDPTSIPLNSWYIYNGSAFDFDPNIIISSC